MIIEESKLIEEKYVDGYYLTINDLRKLVVDYQKSDHISFRGVTNKKAFIERWLKNHNRIVKKD